MAIANTLPGVVAQPGIWQTIEVGATGSDSSATDFVSFDSTVEIGRTALRPDGTPTMESFADLHGDGHAYDTLHLASSSGSGVSSLIYEPPLPLLLATPRQAVDEWGPVKGGRIYGVAAGIGTGESWRLIIQYREV